MKLLLLGLVLLSSCSGFLPGRFEQTGAVYPPLGENDEIRIFQKDQDIPRHVAIGRYSLKETLRHSLDDGSLYNRRLIVKTKARQVGGNGIIEFDVERQCRRVMQEKRGMRPDAPTKWEWVEQWELTQVFLIIRLLPETSGITNTGTNTAPGE